MEEVTRIRLNLNNGEFEVSGSEAFVREYADRFDDLLSILVERRDSPQEFARVRAESTGNGNGKKSGSFGEFFHGVPRSAKDVDRMLIAGYYLQMNSPDQAFTTAQANALLKDQGVKVSNAAQCVRSNVAAKRAFSPSKGKFRVSQAGIDYINQLLGALVSG